MSVISEFYPSLIQKGYTEREIRDSARKHQQRVAPDWWVAKNPQGTYKDYLDDLGDFLNGI